MRNCDKAALYTMIACNIDTHDPGVRDPEGQSQAHAVWMLQMLCTNEIEGNKAHRWLGYAQGILVILGVGTLNQMMEANKRASDEEPDDE